MHPLSLTLVIFVAGYITARWDLVTRLYELAIFAWDHGVVVCSQVPWYAEALTNTQSRHARPRDSPFFRSSSFCSLFPWRDSHPGNQTWWGQTLMAHYNQLILDSTRGQESRAYLRENNYGAEDPSREGLKVQTWSCPPSTMD